jgi:hypothetical protein
MSLDPVHKTHPRQIMLTTRCCVLRRALCLIALAAALWGFGSASARTEGMPDSFPTFPIALVGFVLFCYTLQRESRVQHRPLASIAMKRKGREGAVCQKIN